MRQLGLLREGSIGQGPPGKRQMNACTMLQAGTLRRCAKRLITTALGRAGICASFTAFRIVGERPVSAMRRCATQDSGKPRPTALHLIDYSWQAPSR